MVSSDKNLVHPTIRGIVGAFDPGLLVQLDAALSLRVKNFKRDLFPSLKDIDLAIPGAGFQYVIWVDNEPKFPFPGWEFDPIARPLRYVPSYLASGMHFANIARAVAQHSGGHVEGCIKAICRVLALPISGYGRLPLGTLAKKPHVVKALGTTLTKSLSEYADVLVNEAKHNYAKGTPEPVISFPDALGGYFASRILGFQILEKGGILDKYVQAIRQAYAQRSVYVLPSGVDPGDDPVEWPLQSDLSTLGENPDSS
jgi:hypothetical protein